MEYAEDKSPLIRRRFITKVILALNENLGVSDSSLVIDLIGIVGKLKNDPDKEVSESAFDVDEKIKFYKEPVKEKLILFENREKALKKVEEAI